MSKTVKLEILKALLDEKLLSTEQLWKIINEGLMRFDIGDKVRATINLYSVKSLNGVITAIDRSRSQYRVDFDGVDCWLYENEIERNDEVITRRAASPAFSQLAEINKEIKCKHNMVLYIGLTEQFNYCKHCGDREHEPD